MRRVRASDNTGGIMGVSFSRWVSSSLGRRIFFFSLYFGDRLSDHHVVRRPCTKRALPVKRRAEHKKTKRCY